MNISAISIKNPIPVVMFFLVSTLAGLVAFNSMKIQNLPDMSLPVITVVASLPGAAPEQLESEVVKKIENSIAPTQGLKSIRSKILDGTATVTAEFRLEKPLQEALDEVRSAVSSVRAELPSDVQDPIVNKVNLSDRPVLTYTIASNKMDVEQLSWYVDNDVVRRLLTIQGVGSVSRVGGVEREIQVLIDPSKMKALNLTAGDISRQLKQVQTENSAGRMDIGEGEQPVRAIARVKSAQELNDLELVSTTGVRVKLNEISVIKDTYAEQRTAAYFNGKPVVGFEVSRSKGASEVEVGAMVEESLAKLKAANPDFIIEQSFNFVEPVKGSYDASLHLLYEGALLAVLVVWLFLKDIRATFVPAVALPLSIIPAFIFMNMFGFSINMLTLLAISLVVGILVDDAIVEVENIERHMGMGKSAYQAAMEATQEIGLAVVATTFTLIAVFLPTAFMSGIPGLFFKQFGWTAALAVFFSLVVARLLTPMMAAYVMKANPNKVHKDPSWMKFYIKMVSWSINNRFKTVVGALVFFVGSLVLIPLLPTGFIPADNNSQTQVSLELSPGVTLQQTQKAAEQARQLISEIPDVLNVYTTLGASNDVRNASLTLKLKPLTERPKKQIIESQIRQKMAEIPGVRVKVGLGGNGEKYILSLISEDPQALSTAATNVEKDLRTIKGLGNIASSASLNRTEIALKINYAKAADLGITTNTIADTIRVATVGDYENLLSKVNLTARQVPIVVKLDILVTKDINTLKNLEVKGKNAMFPLSEVADIYFSSSPAVIDRYNRSRNINFEIELSGMQLGEITKSVNNLPSIKNLPQGVSVVPVGDAEIMQELFANFGLAMLTGVLCIYIILVLLFKDFLQPITILAALPLSLGGAFVALLVASQSFSMPSLLGLIMLMGVATKNSILLVEYAIVARAQGMSRLDALINACHKRSRPIIMTTLAMGAGMLPIALQLGSGDGSFRAPMAIAVIGGLITSTFLSLLIIPAIYTYIDDLQEWIKKKLHRKTQTVVNT
jgi:multidrug efflux pump subunit AcrB